MIIVSGTLTIDPTKTERAKELIAELVPATLAEDGNITYGYWSHLEQPGVIFVYEEWADEAALNAHMGSPHMAAFMGSAGELGISSVSINRHDVSASSKLM